MLDSLNNTDMKNISWIHKLVLKWVFKKIVKKGNTKGICEIYKELYNAHRQEFPDDKDLMIHVYMEDVMDHAVQYCNLQNKIENMEVSYEMSLRLE